MKEIIKKDTIPLLISITLAIILIGVELFTGYILNYKHYVGIGLIVISLLLYFKNLKLYLYVFGLTLVIGTLNLIDIYYANIIFGIGPIEFNLIFLTLLIIFLVFNKKASNELIQEKRIIEKEKMIKNFELKFQTKTEAELKNIAEEKSGFVNEAKIASKNILQNK